jgi:hypothetical protein
MLKRTESRTDESHDQLRCAGYDSSVTLERKNDHFNADIDVGKYRDLNLDLSNRGVGCSVLQRETVYKYVSLALMLRTGATFPSSREQAVEFLQAGSNASSDASWSSAK